MLYLRSDEIKSLADKVIRQYKNIIGVDWELFKVEPIKLAEMLGLDVRFVDFGEDSEIMGFTAFNDMSITLTDANQSEITLDLSGRTIVINEALKKGCIGRLNFTITHEIAHHIIDMFCGANYSVKFRRLPHFEKVNNRYSPDYDAEPKWKLVQIFADRGISGTSTKHRDEFNKMIRMCKRGRIDMIITKSISRFARNTVDCLKYVRLLREINVDVYFEEQGIHSIEKGSEFYITVYGSIAQSESENISANVRWGKEQSAREGNVPFHYKNFLGYRKGDDGKPEIVPEEAEIIRYIYERFLAGDSHHTIMKNLQEKRIRTPAGKEIWTYGTIHSILTNEKYMGDAIINKTYTVDCISKKKKRNDGERAKYYVENNHPAIIDRATFGKVQEELARRSGLQKVKQVGTKTELGKYSSKYAFTKLLVCGECGTPYRRCTWTSAGKKRVVWRCISRLDYGKKYCHNSPTIGEDELKSAVMNAIQTVAMQNTGLLQTLKTQIAMNIKCDHHEDKELEIKVRLEEINKEFQEAMSMVTVDDDYNNIVEQKLAALLMEKEKLNKELETYTSHDKSRSESRINDIVRLADILENQPLAFSDELIRQMLQCVVVQSKDCIKVIFNDGTEVEQPLQ